MTRRQALALLYLFWFAASLVFSASLRSPVEESRSASELAFAVAVMAVIPSVWSCLLVEEARRAIQAWRDRKVET